MNSPRSYFTSALMGLVIYASIVLVNDSAEGVYWINRPTKQIVIEVISCLVLGVIFNVVLHAIILLASRFRKTITPQTVLLELLLVVVVSMALFNPGLYLIHYLFNDDVDTRDIIIGNILVVLFILIQYLIVRGYKVMKIYAGQQLELERIANSQMETELKFLKSQYHPHFLFNALNTVYFQMDESVAGAKKTIERLSGLLRYQLYEHQHPVSLSEELEHLVNYIGFMQERSSEKLKVSVRLDPLPGNPEIYPLILQPLVENAFKYVGGNYTLMVSLTGHHGRIFFNVVNSTDAGRQGSGTGIGLVNLRRRLELLYPGVAMLEITKGQDSYEARMELPFAVARTQK